MDQIHNPQFWKLWFTHGLNTQENTYFLRKYREEREQVFYACLCLHIEGSTEKTLMDSKSSISFDMDTEFTQKKREHVQKRKRNFDAHKNTKEKRK